MTHYLRQPNVARMKMDPKLIALGLVVLLLGFGLGFLLESMPNNTVREADLIAQPDPDCRLNEQACGVALDDDSQLEFSIEPRPILGASPLSFSLAASGLEVKSVAVDLAGVDMNMGSYRFTLKESEDNRYEVDGNLPVCVRNQMLWQADLWVDTRKQGLLKIPYQFIAYKY